MLSHPLIAVSMIAVGLPFLVLLALVSSGSGSSPSIFTTSLTVAVVSVFMILMIFEIKRLADQPSEDH